MMAECGSFFQEKDFFSTPLNLSLTMNNDWFRPFKRTAYSVGVIFFVVNNLPREIRFKEENVILAGIIPGPEEPSDLKPFSSSNCRRLNTALGRKKNILVYTSTVMLFAVQQ